MYRIILASESPRRKEIMDQMGIHFESMPSHVEESIDKNEKLPPEIVEELAILKGRDVANRLSDQEGEFIIIGADTMVFHHNEALGKPVDREDAVKMLKSLSADTHEVYTGVCIVIRRKNQANTGYIDEEIVFSVGTAVSVQPLTTEQIEAYVDTREPYDKAGAYAIQGGFGIYISEIHGDYYNVVGFPIAKIHEKLLEHKIDMKRLN